MDPEQWFGAIALGLVQLSPRVATQVKNIADRSPDFVPAIPQHPVTLHDIVDESISLLR
jgi:hypothetical protein